MSGNARKCKTIPLRVVSGPFDLDYSQMPPKIMTECTAETIFIERDRYKALCGVLVAALERTETLASLCTVEQVINAGDEYIDAAGLNPWCLNEGLAEGHETVDLYFATFALNKVKELEESHE